MSDRYALLALAHPRAGWFREVARWASSASLPADYSVCVTTAQAHAHLAGDRPFSAVLVDAGVVGVDRDLVALAAHRGCATLVIDDGGARRDWASLGVAAVLPTLFELEHLVGLLELHARPVDELGRPPGPAAEAPPDDRPPRGRLLAVTGPGGSGSSTVARALAQGLGASGRAGVLLADLALHADQALLHHTGDVVPGLQELVERHRNGAPGAEEVAAHTWQGDGLPYRLLLGLRRHRDWAALRPTAVEATITSLRHAFPVVVADVDPDLEGEAETGSPDLEDRNRLARSVTAQADVVIVTGHADTQGLHRLLRVLHDLDAHGVPATRRQVALVGVPRRPSRRASLVAAIHQLTSSGAAATAPPQPPPIFVVQRADVETTTRDGLPLPDALVSPLTRDVVALLAEAGAPHLHVEADDHHRIEPGSLGGWWLDGEAVGA